MSTRDDDPIPRELFEETLLQFFAPIRPYLDDPSITSIMINGPERVFVERGGRLHPVQARFESHAHLAAALRNAAQFVGKRIDDRRPVLEGRLPDGSQIEAVLPPAAPDGPLVTIRRVAKETLTLERLLELDTLTDEAADALSAFVAAKLNVVVVGAAGSGKTAMLDALASLVPNGERIVLIEGARELQLQRDHVCQLEARPADANGHGELTVRELLRTALRLRPDRIVVGEVRGGEALDLIDAMMSGYGGSLATLRATHPRDTLLRLERMAMTSDAGVPLEALRSQLGAAVNVICHVARLQDGSRKLTHITEVMGYEPERHRYLLQDIFARRYDGLDHHGMNVSELVPTGVLPRALPQLHERGVDLPAGCYAAARRAPADPSSY